MQECEDNETSTDAELRKGLADFGYLLNMPVIKFSEEEKDCLLMEYCDKLAELEELKKKTGADLWEHNSKVFEEALEKQEEKELQDIEDAIKTAQSKLVKGGASGKAKRNKVNVSSLKSNHDAEMVTPVEEDNKKSAKRKSTAPLKVKKTKRAKIKSDDDEDFRI
uniref:DTHCT domain-containing protein n=1 Tax=Strongyloides papillosus TaxID=174720 RepID=A0A0N5B8F5_STREA